MKYKKKLIEVALPLEAINSASAHEKMPGIGPHPRGLHLWWARRPLAAARAVIFSQMVDDPSEHPDIFKTKKAQEKERVRLFELIEKLVKWENTNNKELFNSALDEIMQSWRSTCAENSDHPRAKEIFDRYKLPSFYDPFSGGGALPVEAQRLGLASFASDLNPVAVLINKSMIEFPPKFSSRPPVNPEAKGGAAYTGSWEGSQGLAEDVAYYAKRIREMAVKSIGSLYPKYYISDELLHERPDLQKYKGEHLNISTYIWARTVNSPNPAFKDFKVPLAANFMLSTKAGKEAYIEPIVSGNAYTFKVKVGAPSDLSSVIRGTKSGSSRSSFVCLLSQTPMPFEYFAVREKRED